jgi:hypothetical protein
MPYTIERVEVWAGELEDRPGALSSRLAHVMMNGHANLEMVVARTHHEKPGCAVLFLAPLMGDESKRAALDVGLSPAKHFPVVRIKGPDRPGLVAGIAGTLAHDDINIKGLTASAVGGEAVVYVRLESEEAARAAIGTLKPLLVD